MKDAKKQQQDAIIRKQDAEIKKNRRDGKGGLKDKGQMGFFQTFTHLLLNLSGGVDTPGNAQETLPYLRMHRDGLCEVEPGIYSRSIQFYDINYRLSKDERKSRIFNQFCALLNSIDTTIHMQISFHNQYIDLDQLKCDVELPLQQDQWDDVRQRYSTYLKEQLEAGRNEIQRTKYITFIVKADTVKEARIKLRRVEDDLIHQLSSVMKVRAHPLCGKDRLRILYESMRDSPKDNLFYDFGEQAKAGLTSRDAIAPSGFDFRYTDMFGIGDRWACASYFQIDANRLHDTVLSDFLDMDGALLLSIHLQPVNQEKAIRTIKRKIADIDSMKAAQNKKAVEQGIDMDIMPTDINTYGAEAREWLDGLQTKDERYFLMTFIVVNIADTKAELESVVLQAGSIAQQHNCSLKRFRFHQEQAFQSVLPLGKNHVPVKRGMTTTGTGILMPFITEDLYMGKGSLHYGRNPLSQRLILINRKELTNPNSLVLGIPGSGKSVAAKLEMAEVRLSTNDDLLVIDVEREYAPLVEMLGGKVLDMSLNSSTYVNIMDMNLDYNSEDASKKGNPVAFKAMFLLGVFNRMMNGEMSYTQRSVVDRCIHLVYEDFMKDPKPEHLPILGNVYQALDIQPEECAQTVKAAMEIYVHGSLNYFNHHTNLDLGHHGGGFYCFDIHSLEGVQRELGMLALTDHVWNRVTQNRLSKIFTWFWADEFHILLQSPDTAECCVRWWKRMRKFYALPTGITQNVSDFLNNPNASAVESILSNTPFIRMLEQTHADATVLSKFLDISEDQMGYVDSPQMGHGLLKCGGTILPFANRLPKDNVLYPYITTKPGEA